MESVSQASRNVKKPIQSSTLRCGRRTFFFDVHMASNNKRYLRITESRFIGEGNETKRSSFLLFGEEVPLFQEKLNEIAGHLS